MNEPKIVDVGVRNLVATRMTMSLSENKTRELWQGFRPRVNEIPDRVGTDFFSIQHYPDNFSMADFRPHTVFEKLAGVEVESHAMIPDGMERHTLLQEVSMQYLNIMAPLKLLELPFNTSMAFGFQIQHMKLIVEINSKS